MCVSWHFLFWREMGCARHYCSTHAEYKSSLCFLKHTHGYTARTRKKDRKKEQALATWFDIFTKGILPAHKYRQLHKCCTTGWTQTISITYNTQSSNVTPILLLLHSFLPLLHSFFSTQSSSGDQWGSFQKDLFHLLPTKMCFSFCSRLKWPTAFPMLVWLYSQIKI